jgi:hypothetical protein
MVLIFVFLPHPLIGLRDEEGLFEVLIGLRAFFN